MQYRPGSPLHRGNREDEKHLCQGKHREFGHFAKYVENREFCIPNV